MNASSLRRALLACPLLGLAAVAAAQPAPAPPSVDWEHLPPPILKEITDNGGPVYAYRMVFNHFKPCAIHNGKELQPLASIERDCTPLPPEPTARNLFNLDAVPKDQAKPIVRMYLEAQGYLRRPPSAYVLDFMKASPDPDYADDLAAFQTFSGIVKAADTVRYNAAHPPSFWSRPLRGPDFNAIDTSFGIDPISVVRAFNIPLTYLLFWALLPISLIRVSGVYTQRGIGESILDRLIAKDWARLGYVDKYAFHRAYGFKWYLITCGIASIIMVTVSLLFCSAPYCPVLAFLSALSVSHYIGGKSDYYWKWRFQQNTTAMRFVAPFPAPVAPAGEHGTARLQGAADLASSGFVDED